MISIVLVLYFKNIFLFGDETPVYCQKWPFKAKIKKSEESRSHFFILHLSRVLQGPLGPDILILSLKSAWFGWISSSFFLLSRYIVDAKKIVNSSEYIFSDVLGRRDVYISVLPDVCKGEPIFLDLFHDSRVVTPGYQRIILRTRQ